MKLVKLFSWEFLRYSRETFHDYLILNPFLNFDIDVENGMI